MKIARIKITNSALGGHTWCYYPGGDTNIRINALNDRINADSVHYVFRQIISSIRRGDY